MKNRSLLFLLIAVLVLWASVGVGLAETGYFGNAVVGSSSTTATAGRTFWNVTTSYQSTIPGQVIELSAYVKSAGGTPGNMRLALYDSAGTTLICQGNAQVLVSSTTAAWVAHTGLTGTCYVAATTDYKLAISFDSTDVVYYYDAVTSGYMVYKDSSDYTGGYPSSLPSSPTNTTHKISVQANVARARYWVGGSGNWSDATNHWALTSGGAPGAGNLPDNDSDLSTYAYFDSNSHTSSYTVTIDAAAAAQAVIFANPASGSPTLAGSATLNAGAITLVSGMTASYTGAWGGGTITSNGVAWNGSIAGSYLILNDDLTLSGAGKSLAAYITHNDHAVTISGSNFFLWTERRSLYALTVTSSAANTLTLGGDITVMNSFTASGASASQRLRIQSRPYGPQRYLSVYGPISVSNVDFWNINTNGIIGGLHNGSANSADLVDTTKNFANWGVEVGDAVNNLTDGSTGTVATITTTTNTNDTLTMTLAGGTDNDWDVSDKYYIAGTVWDLSGATGGSGNVGNNTGITFTTATTRYWVGNGGSWSSTAHWSTSSGGSTGASVPLAQDTVVFDANSISSGSQTVTADVAVLGKDISFAAVTNTPALNLGSAYSTYATGSLTLGTITLSSSGASKLTLTGDGTHTLTSAGVSFPAGYSMAIDGVGTYTLQDGLTLSSTGVLSLYSGTLTANDQTVTTGAFRALGVTGTKVLNMGTGNWNISGSDALDYRPQWEIEPAATALTVNPSTSTIRFTDTSDNPKTLTAATKLFHDLWYASSGIAPLRVMGYQDFTTTSSVYFGNPTAGASSSAATAGHVRFANTVKYQSTIAGTITELSAYVKSAGGTPGNMRLALYDSAGTTLICQGNAQVLVSSTTAAWVAHTGVTGTCTVAASTDYRMAITFDSSDVTYYYDTGTSGDWQYVASSDYTDSGYPASLPGSPSNTTRKATIRVGVYQSIHTVTFDTVTGNTSAIRYNTDNSEYIRTLAWDPCACIDPAWSNAIATTNTVRIYEVLGGNYTLVAEVPSDALQATFLHGGPGNHTWVARATWGGIESTDSNQATWSHTGARMRFRIPGEE